MADPTNITEMRARLMEIRAILAAPNTMKWDSWREFKTAERVYKRKRAAWRMLAPGMITTVDDVVRKATADDISAFIDGQPEIQLLQDDLIVKEEVWLAASEATFRLKDEMEAIRSSLADFRNERRAFENYG